MTARLKKNHARVVINMKCEECGKREAVVSFSSEPMYAITHGYDLKEICRHCYIEIIEQSLNEVKNNLKKQKRLLKNEGVE